MSQNQEIIESKLCAYIDQELDEAGQQEIEKHLEANPQHRRLLEELRRTSALLGSLPREQAPTELSELFTGQLERSSLLQGINEGAETGSMRIHRWSQTLAVAAILFLTVGLAAIVYFALPSFIHHPAVVLSGHGTEVPDPSLNVPAATLATPATSRDKDATNPSDVVASAPPEARFESTEGGQRSSTADLAAPPTAFGASKAATHPAAPSASAPGIALANSGSGNVTDEHATLRKVARNALSDARVQSLVRAEDERDAKASDAAAAGTEVVMVVRSSDVTQTRQVLTDYFDSNRIAWEVSSSATPALKSTADEQLAANLDAAAKKDAAHGAFALADGVRGDRSAGGGQAAGRGVAAAPAALPPATGPAEAKRELAAAAPSTTRPTENRLAATTGALNPARSGDFTLQHQATAGESEAIAGQGDVYFAARMSHQQAEALGLALKRDASAGPVDLIGLSSWRRARKSDNLDLHSTEEKAKGGRADGMVAEAFSAPRKGAAETQAGSKSAAADRVAGPTTGPTTIPAVAQKQFHFERVAKPAAPAIAGGSFSDKRPTTLPGAAPTPSPIAPVTVAPATGPTTTPVAAAGAVSGAELTLSPTTGPVAKGQATALAKEAAPTASMADDDADKTLGIATDALADAVNVVIVLRGATPASASEPANLTLHSPSTRPATTEPAVDAAPTTAPAAAH